MKILIKQKAILALLLLGLLVIPDSAAYAAGNQISVELAVRQTIEYENAALEQFNKTGTYELTGLTEDAPMPEGSGQNLYAFSLNGVNETAEIPITYTHGGMYQYQLVQTTKKQDGYTWDETKYRITVYIKNSENGGLISEVIAEKGSGKKSGEIIFQNEFHGSQNENQGQNNGYQGQQYHAGISRKPVKTGDETNRMMWLILGSSSAAFIIVMSIKKYKNKRTV